MPEGRAGVVTTAGIDLATQPERTAACVVEWVDGRGRVELHADRSDDGLVAICDEVDKVGIDCPLGWPDPFVAALVDHRDGKGWPGRGVPVDEFRASLALRATDRAVMDLTGCRPLSVAADRIGLTAMRCALMLDRLDGVDRTGVRGAVAEVYPAASLRTWGLTWSGYKGRPGRSVRESMMTKLCEQSPLEFAPGVHDQCVDSDDALDALVCALTAFAVTRNETHLPSAEQAERAAREGWIHVPRANAGDPSSRMDAI